MPPRRAQPTRQTQANANAIDPILVAKRTKRHLDELERSNFTELAADADQGDHETRGIAHRGAARQTIISDRGDSDRKNKSTMNVRSALLYRKNLATLIDESGISALPAPAPSYLTAFSPPSKVPPRLLCAVCGYWGAYKCQRCALPYCDLNCDAVHRETRCERRVL